MEQIIGIFEFILKSFLHIWPYLLVTIPFAVVINLSGASKYINRAFGKNPLLSVLLATVVGAFSPFCSCGVIPVISSLLIGGVPLAPVMSFWLASPSMDPEIFFLSSSVLGWELSVWRLTSTFIISLFAGYLTHIAAIKGYISNDILKTRSPEGNQNSIKSFMKSFRNVFRKKQVRMGVIPVVPVSLNPICCQVSTEQLLVVNQDSIQTEADGCNCNNSEKKENASYRNRLFEEIMKATIMVTKFMGIAFLITALIKFYLPDSLLTGIVKGNSVLQVTLATLIGIPMYASNITALPVAGGLIDIGLNKGAALSFLIAGATTTLPAMIAVWGITKRKVFFLYLSFALFGAFLAGMCFNLFN